MELKTQKQQAELFHNFGQPKKQCQGCNQILPAGTQKIENYLFCGKCKEIFNRKDKVRFLVIPETQPPFFAARFNLIQFQAKMIVFDLHFKIYTKDGQTWDEAETVFTNSAITAAEIENRRICEEQDSQPEPYRINYRFGG